MSQELTPTLMLKKVGDLAKLRKPAPAMRMRRLGYPEALINKVSQRYSQPPQSVAGPALPRDHKEFYPRRYAGSLAARQSKNISAVKK